MQANPTRRQMLLTMTGATLGLGLAARAEAPEVLRGSAPTRRIEGRAFGTLWRVTLPDSSPADSLYAPLGDLLALIDRQMSPWRADSELSAFNLAPRSSAVSPETAFVTAAALDVASKSGGWFDPTVGPLVARWGFGPIVGDDAPRWRGLSVDGNRVAKDAAGLTLDLCGIAKGRALDLMARRIEAEGITDFLVDLGGELAVRGRHPSGRDWQVAIEDPRPGVDGAAAGLRLAAGLAVATSGLRAQSYDLGAKRYGHIIDPRHVRPADGPLASVTVIGRTGMHSDAWATALAAAGHEGPALARRQGLDAVFLFREGAGLRRETTGGANRYLI